MLELVQTKADDMSIDDSAMPPWKRELLERKRRQEEEDRKRREEELDRLAHMPPWKRELFQKKKKTTIYMSRSASTNDVDASRSDCHRAELAGVNGSVVDSCVTVTVVQAENAPSKPGGCAAGELDWSATGDDVRDNGETQEEHLLPIESNPWLKLDSNNKIRGRHVFRKSKDSTMTNDGLLSEQGSQVSCTSPNCSSRSDGFIHPLEGDAGLDRNDDDSVFTEEEEVTYGKGFVHRLLEKFKHLSAQEDCQGVTARKPSPKRTQSSENILEEHDGWKCSPRSYIPVGDKHSGYSSLSRRKAQSMDCLVSKTKPESLDSSSGSSRLSESLAEVVCEETNTSVSSVTKSEPASERTSGEVLHISNSEENIIEELPRTNIVSVARSVFESISNSQEQRAAKKQSSSEHVIIRSSSASSISSGHNTGSARIASSSSADLNRYLRDSTSTSVNKASSSAIGCGEADDTNMTPSSLESSNDRRVAGSRIFYSGKKSEPTVETSAMRSGHVQKMNPSVGILRSQLESDADKTGGTTALSQSEDMTEGHAAAKNTLSSAHSSTSEDSSPAPYVPKTQEYLDQTSRDQVHISTTSDLSKAVPAKGSIHASREAPALLEEITMELNSSAKDTVDSRVEAKNDVHPESFVDSGPLLKVGASTKDVVASTAEHRNPEANRLNLNLNLNELSRKKMTTEGETDINRNNKTSSVATTDAVDGANENFSGVLVRKKRLKKLAPTGPGSLLIRPASNLVAVGVKSEYLCLNRYRDIKEGEFAPAKKRPSYYYEDSSDDDVPVTDIDDYLPVTNIDDVSPIGTPREGDPTKHKRPGHKYEFVGAGVILDRSLLSKTKNKKMKLNFNDDATSTFEYPSEQTLLSIMPPEPGDFDFHDPNAPAGPVVNGSASVDDPPEFREVSALRTTPGVGSAGTLGSYQSKCQVDYFFGMEQKQPKPAKKPEEPKAASTNTQPASDEDLTWSDATSSDMLF